MKKTILLLAVAMISLTAYSQNLAEIIKNHEKAVGSEKMESFKTTKVVGVMSQGGMTINMTILEKNPDKMRTEMEVMGQKIVTVINGDKGYMINPMMGSTTPVALSSSEIAASQNNKVIGSTLSQQMKDGKLELIGDSEVNGKSSFKIKSVTDAGNVYTFIDKKEFLINMVEMEVSQMGQTFTTTMKMTDYRDVKGVKIAHKILTSAAGQDGVLELTKIEFDVSIEDSNFEVK